MDRATFSIQEIAGPARVEIRGPVFVALLAAVLFWVLVWYFDTAESMAMTWWRSETFAHGLLIYPLCVWMIWRKRAQLANLPIEPCFAASVPFGLAGFAWLLGDLADVQAVRQFGLVTMIPLGLWTILGTRWVRAIAFPLAFTLLAVPVGEFMLPVMMEQTADFTIAALRLTGIPVYREGLNFHVPSGNWSVIEACSGLRYLIASVTLGLLYAYLSYRSLKRRMLFILASILVPIVANWVRAYMIVMIGHLSGMKYAVGVDHLIYGWVFFGVVMLLLFWVGSWWREDDQADPIPTRPHAEIRGIPPGIPLTAAVGAVGIAALAVWPPLHASYLDPGHAMEFTKTMDAPLGAGGWELAVNDRVPEFRPHFRNTLSVAEQSYEKNGRQVRVFLGYYEKQREGAEMIAFGNAILITLQRTGWTKLSERHVSSSDGEGVVETRLKSNRSPLTVWHGYWVGGRWVDTEHQAKLYLALEKLLGRGDESAVVVLFTEAAEGPADDSAAILGQFLAAMRPSIFGEFERLAGRSARPRVATP